MIDNIIDISIKNGMPTASWVAYIPYIVGVFGVIVIFSAVVLIVSWVRKRNGQLQQENTKEPE
ncbi:MAG: hypothetical protein ACTSXA_06685 [Candidatus Heimdallarchaeota archaeon]